MVSLMPDTQEHRVAADSDNRASQSTAEKPAEPAAVFWPACGALCDTFWWARGSRPFSSDKA